MKRITALSMLILFSMLLCGCGKHQFSIEFLVPAESTAEQDIWSDVEISPTRKKVTFSLPAGSQDLEVFLKSVEVKKENAYEPFYLTPGQSVTLELEKGAWFKVSVHTENDSNEDRTICLDIQGVAVRVASEYADGNSDDEASFISVMQGTIKNIENSVLYVEPAGDAWERRASDLFTVSIVNMPSSSEPEIDDIVEETYQGGILETYPASFEKVLSISVISESDMGMQDKSPEGTEKAKTEILSEAPLMKVMTAVQTVTAMRGTTSWEYRVEEEKWICYDSDCLHPLDEAGKEMMPMLQYDPEIAMDSYEPNDALLLFDVVPDLVTVRFWDEKYWGYPDDDDKAEIIEVSTEISVSDYRLELMDGGYVYEVIAEWNSSSDYSGTARYCFYASPMSK